MKLAILGIVICLFALLPLEVHAAQCHEKDWTYTGQTETGQGCYIKCTSGSDVVWVPCPWAWYTARKYAFDCGPLFNCPWECENKFFFDYWEVQCPCGTPCPLGYEKITVYYVDVGPPIPCAVCPLSP